MANNGVLLSALDRCSSYKELLPIGRLLRPPSTTRRASSTCRRTPWWSRRFLDTRSVSPYLTSIRGRPIRLLDRKSSLMEDTCGACAHKAPASVTHKQDCHPASIHPSSDRPADDRRPHARPLASSFAMHPTCIRAFVLASLLFEPTVSSLHNFSDLEILDRLLNNYDRRATPTDKQGIATNVSCQIFIRSFGSINPMTMDYQVDLYLRQSWMDHRFRSDYLTKALDLNDANLVRRIWKPEVFFANAKHADFQYVTVPNVLVRIEPNGHILYMLRLKLTFACMMDLYKYPLDSQVCTMEIASFSKTTKELQLTWIDNQPVKMTRGIKLPQFEIEDTTASKCNATFHIGEYSCLVAQFYLKRSIGFHLVQSYLPTVLIVVISWMSFWLDVDAIPTRITLGVTTLLTISSTGIQTNLPQVSYVKAMDVWMGACTIFVFAALLEFTFVNYTWRKQTRRSKCTKRQDEINDEQIGETELSTISTTFDQKVKSKRRVKTRAMRIDCICRVCFPLGYLLFNVFYWPYYLL